ncbi:fimbrial protein TcfB [Achromobacter xylosoxidans]
MKFKKSVCAMVLLGIFASGAAMADTYKEITVTANVDPTLDLKMADLSTLPDTITMLYDPAHGLHPVRLSTRLLSNKSTTGEHPLASLNVRLNHEAVLDLDSGPSNPVPLTITFAGKNLSTTNTAITKAELGMGDNGHKNASKPLELKVSQTRQAVISPAGNYSGKISLILSEQVD